MVRGLKKNKANIRCFATVSGRMHAEKNRVPIRESKESIGISDMLEVGATREARIVVVSLGMYDYGRDKSSLGIGIAWTSKRVMRITPAKKST